MEIKKSRPPAASFLFTHPAHFIACGLGSGLSPWAPGTAGTAAGWLLYLVLRPWFSELGFMLWLAATFVLGIWACDKTGRDLRVADHGSIVWDEIVPFWLVLFCTPAGPAWQLIAFLAFRFFDIVKPPPARWADRNLKNGFGVMLDDLFAALWSIAAIQVAAYALRFLDLHLPGLSRAAAALGVA
ncbi:MAG: phosphatidylglycerophosphatase A [Rhodocyclaceae bacterium]|nr:phosphatidylglycerophosphatase A [Rhodocyclaceae bacterium]